MSLSQIWIRLLLLSANQENWWVFRMYFFAFFLMDQLTCFILLKCNNVWDQGLPISLAFQKREKIPQGQKQILSCAETYCTICYQKERGQTNTFCKLIFRYKVSVKKMMMTLTCHALERFRGWERWLSKRKTYKIVCVGVWPNITSMPCGAWYGEEEEGVQK